MLDDYTQPKALQTGLFQLKQRQQRLRHVLWWSIGFTLLLVITFAVHDEIILSFWGLSEELKQLHIPVTADDYLTMFAQQQDYFWNLMSWIGWLVLKVFSAFFGAFIIVHVLKKIRYFYQKFQSFIMKFVAWLIAFICIWSALTYVQYENKNDPQIIYAELVDYQDNIQQSLIAQHLKESQTPVTVADYLLVQTALMNKDLSGAEVYLNRLVMAEQKDPNFKSYGFLPEQIWIMQYQVYGKPITPIATQVNPEFEQAESVSQIVQMSLVVFLALSLLISGGIWALQSNIKNRIDRISNRII